ncbi:MAG: cell division protein FtsZ [Rhodoferax sp.]|nr:cell division protein FtsZ [Rhodoferax sp.]
MSTLQIGLAVAGGLALVGVVAYNIWNTHRNAPRQASPGRPKEPAMDAGEPSASVSDPQHSAVPNTDIPDLPLPTPPRRPALDALIDVIAVLTLDPQAGPVPGEVAMAALPQSRRVGSKPFAVEGFNQRTQQWENPTPGQRYSSFQAGVQLANRSGALNDIEYSEFVVKAQAFADALGATPEFPEMHEEVARARELDHFASAHDAQLRFTLRPCNASWSPGYVQQNAAPLGFVLGAVAGRMVLPAGQHGLPPVLVLGFDAQAALAEDPSKSAIRAISLHLEVAQVERGEQAFLRLREVAFALAQTMDGVVTDDNGQPLTAESLDIIGKELETLYNTLEQRDLAAGSAVARRLFS